MFPCAEDPIETVTIKPKLGELLWLELVSVDAPEEPNLIPIVDMEDVTTIIKRCIAVWNPLYMAGDDFVCELGIC